MRTRTWIKGLLAMALTYAGVPACAPSSDQEPAGGPVAEAQDGLETALDTSENPDQDGMNSLSDQERQAGWRLLFDGESLDHWRGYRRDDLPDGWRAVDGAMTLVAPAGDIITREQFGRFELSLEWRVEEGGNSGILYLATEEPEIIWHAAPEMQVLDDAAHPDGQSPLTSAGSAYALYPASRGVVNEAGEWNTSRLLVDGTHVEHWMNGQRLLEYELGSEDFERRVAGSKFAVYPSFAEARRGHIGLQDHGDPVWYRNIKIRELE